MNFKMADFDLVPAKISLFILQIIYSDSKPVRRLDDKLSPQSLIL